MRRATCLLTTALLFVTSASIVSAETLVIDGGTVHPISGAPYVGRVVVEDGVITAAGRDAAAPSGATRIDASGLHVYPGLFDAMSTIGLVEVSAVQSTNDQAEMGAYNPHLHATTAVHPSSAIIPVTRANGITQSLVVPRSSRGGVISGQASVVHLSGWTVEEMTVEPAAAMILAWPAIETRRFDFTTFQVVETPFNEAKEKAEKAIDELRDWFDAARHYRQAEKAGSTRLTPDRRLAALSRCLDGEMTVIVRANQKRDIEAAVAFAEEQGIEIVLAGGRDAWELTELLAEKEIPVILGQTLSNPAREDHPYDRPFRTPGQLVDAGIDITFATGTGGRSPHSSRTVPYEAAAAVSHGLSEADALRAVTLGAAEILGVGDRLGSIETGKIANLIVTDGNPLEVMTQVKHVVVGGREVPTANLHRDLYEEYRGRYAGATR